MKTNHSPNLSVWANIVDRIVNPSPLINYDETAELNPEDKEMSLHEFDFTQRG